MIGDPLMRVRQMMGPRFNLEGLDIEDLRTDNRERAEHQVSRDLLLLAIAKGEKREVDEAAIEDEIARLAATAGEQAQRAMAQLRQPEEREVLSYRLLEDKTI